MFWRLFKGGATPPAEGDRGSNSEASDSASLRADDTADDTADASRWHRGARKDSGGPSSRDWGEMDNREGGVCSRLPSFEDMVSSRRRRGGIDLSRSRTRVPKDRDPWGEGPEAEPGPEVAAQRRPWEDKVSEMPAACNSMSSISGLLSPPTASDARNGMLRDYRSPVVLHQASQYAVLRALHTSSGRLCVLRVHAMAHMLPSQHAALETEVAILRSVQSSPHCIKLLRHHQDAASVYLVLEAAEGGNLAAAIAECASTGLDAQSVAADVVKPVLRAMADLHAIDVVHRNINPWSVLFADDGRAILNDFRNAKQLESGPNDCVGYQNYAAPEVVAAPTLSEIFQDVLNHGADEADIPRYGTSVDVWALGVLTYEALTGQLPFPEAGDREGRLAAVAATLADVAGGDGPDAQVPRPWLAALPRDAALFVHRCLRFRAGERPSAAELLSDPWLARAEPRPLESSPVLRAAMRRSLELPARTRKSLERGRHCMQA